MSSQTQCSNFFSSACLDCNNRKILTIPTAIDSIFRSLDFLFSTMSRTQRKLQAMSAQEMLIQEKKRKIEEKLRVDGAKKIHVDSKLMIIRTEDLQSILFR